MTTAEHLNVGNDHKLVDNGAGYDLICPTLGKSGLQPYFSAKEAVVGKWCACGYRVTNVTPFPPKSRAS
jgi:hypothetical protein